MIPFPEASVNKIVPLKFAGVDLRLKTSHALFSSHQVDLGTILLLKTLAQQKVLPESGRVLDAGCGYGPLALAIKKHRPALEVTARDRLALAAVYTAENARLNGLQIDAGVGLLLEEVPGPWNLIVSNLPAKAGEPVLADFVRRSLSLVSSTGKVAVVIVETLAPWFLTRLEEASATIHFQEAGQGYRVFHYSASKGPLSVLGPAFPAAYRRSEMDWNVGNLSFVQKTAFGLPNFDSLDFRLQMTLPLLEHWKPRGETLVWEPVQGHLATWADRVLDSEAIVHLAGNDALALAVARENLTRPSVALHCVPSLVNLELGAGSLGSALVQLHPEPEVPWVEEFREALLRLLAPGARVILNGSSTDLTRFLEKHRGLRVLTDERAKGWRAVVLERQSLS